MFFALCAQQEGDCSDDVAVHVNNQQTLENSEIIVAIGSSRQRFPADKLSKLSYFNAILSARWMQTESNDVQEIEVLPPNEANCNSIHFDFTCQDLQFLLKCVEQSKIPENARLNLNQLESLLYCNDYLNAQPSESKLFSINEPVLMNYFCDCVPSLHKEKRDEWLLHCTHPMLRKVLQELVDDYDKIFQESQANFCEDSFTRRFNEIHGTAVSHTNSYRYIKSIINRVQIGCDLATKLFESRFNLHANFRICSQQRTAAMNSGVIRFATDERAIDDFSQHYTLCIAFDRHLHTYPRTHAAQTGRSGNVGYRSVLWDLWDVSKNGRCLSLSTFKKIDGAIEKILNLHMIKCPIKVPVREKAVGDQIKFICCVLLTLALHIMSQQLKNGQRILQSTKHINVCSLVQAVIMIFCRFPTRVPFTSLIPDDTRRIAQFLNTTENEALATLILKLGDKYFKEYGIKQSNRNLCKLNECKESIDCWIELLKNVLLGCSKEFVIREMRKWFPLLHGKRRKWLMEQVNAVKRADEYKVDWTPNDNNNNNNNDNDESNEKEDEKEYFNNEMIDEIVKFNNFDYERETAEWIIDNLILTTEQCFQFGIYVSEYIVFNTSATATTCPQVYIDFMERHCGIAWSLI